MGRFTAAIIQVPWRHEFYIAHAYVEIDLRIRRNFVLRKVRFMVIKNDMNQIVLGAPFAQKYFKQISL